MRRLAYSQKTRLYGEFAGPPAAEQVKSSQQPGGAGCRKLPVSNVCALPDDIFQTDVSELARNADNRTF